MPLAPASAARRANSVPIGGLKPVPANTGTRPPTSSTAASMTAKCSVGESEYSSPVPAGATTAQTECFNKDRRLRRKPSKSSERSGLKGVTGKEMTPCKRWRSSFGCIRKSFQNSLPASSAFLPSPGNSERAAPSENLPSGHDLFHVHNADLQDRCIKPIVH